MKPSIESVQSRLGLTPTIACRCDWRLRSGLHRGRGKTTAVTYRCAKCGTTKSVTVSAWFEEKEKAR